MRETACPLTTYCISIDSRQSRVALHDIGFDPDHEVIILKSDHISIAYRLDPESFSLLSLLKERIKMKKRAVSCLFDATCKIVHVVMESVADLLI